MDRTQEKQVIGKVDRRFWITAGMLLAVPAIALIAYHLTRFGGLTNSEALDFAQIGRNLVAGRGFTTFVLRPLALTHGPDPTQQPDVVHGPLYPFILALAFGLPSLVVGIDRSLGMALSTIHTIWGAH